MQRATCIETSLLHHRFGVVLQLMWRALIQALTMREQ